MKKSLNIIKCFATILLLAIGFNAKAQQLNMDVRDFDGNMQVFDPANPNSSKNKGISYSDIEGSPFWSDKWNPAIVFFSGGGKAKINQAKLNLYTNEIHYLSSDGTELAVENEGITSIVFLNKNNLTQPIASFAKLVNHLTGNGTVYYKVLNSGIFQLIVLQKKLVKTSPYDPIQGKSITSFYARNDYAIYNEGKIIPLKDLDRIHVLNAVPLDIVTSDWLRSTKSRLKTENEVTAYLEQVNLSNIKVGNK
jgi:hypothetical protein